MGIPGPISFLEGSRGISANRSLLGDRVDMLGDQHVWGWVCLVMSMSRGVMPRGWVCSVVGISRGWQVDLMRGRMPTLLLIPSNRHHIYGRQAGGKHPT